MTTASNPVVDSGLPISRSRLIKLTLALLLFIGVLSWCTVIQSTQACTN